MNQTKKVSQSYEKVGECVAELPCEQEFSTRVVFRSKEVHHCIGYVLHLSVAKESKSTKKFKCSSPSWMVIAKRKMNKKVQRNRDKTIMKYHDLTGIGEIRKKYNRSIDFGKKVNILIYGAIGVKSRKHGGHVAFVMGVDNVKTPLYVYMLGGNQDGIDYSKVKKGQKVDRVSYKDKSKLAVKRYKLSSWNIGFYVPNSYCATNCRLNIYRGSYILGKGDGN